MDDDLELQRLCDEGNARVRRLAAVFGDDHPFVFAALVEADEAVAAYVFGTGVLK
jgi:hypothetical protein